MSSLTKAAPSSYSLRWIISADLPSLLPLADLCPTLEWSTEDFRECFRSVDTIGKVVSVDGSPIGFVQSPGEDVPVWWTADPARAPVLTGWAGGPDAAALLRLDEKSRAERSLQCLSRLFALPRATLDQLVERCWTYDWSRDPFSLGAYSYVGVGGTDAPQVLARPVRETLFFAGDYLNGGTMGTVEGALEGGRLAALRLLESRTSRDRRRDGARPSRVPAGGGAMPKVLGPRG